MIQLNIVHSILIILDTLQAELNRDPLPTMLSAGYSASSHVPPFPHAVDRPRTSVDTEMEYYENADRPGSMSTTDLSSRLTDKHQLLMRRLGPLRALEGDLKRRLGTASEEEACCGNRLGVLGEPLTDLSTSSPQGRRRAEFGIRGWKHLFANALAGRSGVPGARDGDRAGGGQGDVDEATELLARCREDMKELWADEDVGAVLRNRRMRLEDSAGL